MENEDFGFYGEEEDESVVDDIHGITDTVTNYTYTNLQYPCIIFKEGFTLKSHKWRVISNMVKAIDKDKDTALYFKDNGNMVKLGSLSGRQVESFLELVGCENLLGYYLDGTKLEGDRLYTLCVL